MKTETPASDVSDDLGGRIIDYLQSVAGRNAASDSSSERPALILTDSEKDVVRSILFAHEEMLLGPYESGRFYTALVRAFMLPRDRLHFSKRKKSPLMAAMLGLLNVVAYGLRALPRNVLPKLSMMRVRVRPGASPSRRVRAEIYRQKLPLDPLLRLVDDVPQSRAGRAYEFDEHRHTAVGMVVGFDVLKCGGHWTAVEANNSVGQMDQWEVRGEDNPFIEHIVEFAKARGFRRVCILNNDRGLQGSQERLYKEAATRAGVELQIIEPASVPATHLERGASVPDHFEPGTLCVRIRNFRTWADFVIGNKQAFNEALGDYLAEQAVDSLHVPDTGPGWLDRVDWHSGPLPNMVAKLSGADRGIGVAFYKAKDKAHALDIMSTDEAADFRLGGMLGSLVRATRPGRKYFQAYVPSDRFDDGRLAVFRVNVLITPVGSKFLSALKIIAGSPVPATLPEGAVSDPSPYLAHAAHGGSRNLPGDAELASIEPVADVLASAVDSILRQQFRVAANG